MQKQSTPNQKTERQCDWEAKLCGLRVAGSSSLRDSNIPCEWRHLKTYTESSSHGVSQLLRNSSFTVWVLPNFDSRTIVKCGNIFCVSLWQITSHNGTPPCHDNAHLKSIENSDATMTQLAKHFHAKDSVFLAEMPFCGFTSISIHCDRS